MTQNNDKQKKQPWESSFEENGNEEVQSRAELRKRSSRTGWIVSLLILAVVILAAYPVFSYVKSINSAGSRQDDTTQTEVSLSSPTKNNEDKAKKDSAAKESKSSQEMSESIASSESVAAKQSSQQLAMEEESSRQLVRSSLQSSQEATRSSQAAAIKSSQEAAQSSQAAAMKSSQEAAQQSSQAIENSKKNDSSQESSTNSNKQMATVTINAYRLGLAHGLSMPELQNLNPGVDLNNVGVGQELRVK